MNKYVDKAQFLCYTARMKYRTSEFARRIGVTAHTLRRWEREGRLSPSERTLGGHRIYTELDLQTALRLPLAEKVKRNVIYCRVSSAGQKDDLQSQIVATEAFALGRGLITETIAEIGGGMNFNRKKFNKLLIDIIAGEIGTVIVAHEDRLARFGFDLINNLAVQYGCTIIAVNKKELSPEQEMTEDLMSIIHIFSCRLYGLRKYKKAKDLIGG